MKYTKWFIFIFVIIVGCSTDQKNIKNIEALPLEKTAKPDTISIENETQFYNLRSIYNINDEYLVFVDEVDKEVFKVFSLPELEFLYAWGRMGRGPHELSELSFGNITTSEDQFVFYFGGYAQLKYYTVTDTAFVFDQDRPFSFLASLHAPINDLVQLNDSLFISWNMAADFNNYEYAALTPGQNKPQFFFSPYPEPASTEGLTRKYSSVTAGKPDGSKFAAFYRMHNKFKIFDDEGTLLQEVNVNDPSLSNTDEPGFIYRIGAEATDQYIYTLAVNNTGKKLEQNPQAFKTSLEVWDWNGEPVQRFKLSKTVPRFAVSETHSKIYGFSTSIDNVIYEYDLGEVRDSKNNEGN